MTPDKQRIAIAEACGWKSVACPCGEDDCTGMQFPFDEGCWGFPPDYLTDLNAMHDAEKTLSDTQKHVYEEHLFDTCYFPTMATVSQRAEAFLRTIGKWGDKA